MNQTTLNRQKVKAACAIARTDLLEYARLCDYRYVASKVHRYIATKLTSGVRRLIINVPPRHGKSRLTTVELPTFVLGEDPLRKILLTSYSTNLASKHSKEARARMQQPIYREMFPETELNTRDMGAEEWTTTKGGLYKATGIGGSLTGHGGDLLIVDDPFKDYEEAHSETIRENVWNWFLSTAYTRLSPGGTVIIIMTRWHVDDLIGRLLDPKRQQEMRDAGIDDDEQWELVNLKAIADSNDDPLGRAPGEALFPEKFPLSRLKSIRQMLGTYLWTALYEGRPVPKGGNYVNPEHFHIIARDIVPEGLCWMRFWDLATSTKATADYTAGIKGAMGPAPVPAGLNDAERNIYLEKTPYDCLYLADMITGQWEWQRARATIKSTAELEQIFVGVEAVSGFKTAYSNLREVISADVAMQDFGVDKDKLTRALPWIALTEARKVYLVAGDWVPGFKSQVEAFPTGTHDDMVDAVSGVYSMLKNGRVILVA